MDWSKVASLTVCAAFVGVTPAVGAEQTPPVDGPLVGGREYTDGGDLAAGERRRIVGNYLFNSAPGEQLLTLTLSQSKQSSARGCRAYLRLQHADEKLQAPNLSGPELTFVGVGQVRSRDTRHYAIHAEARQYRISITSHVLGGVRNPARRCPFTFSVGPAQALTDQAPAAPRTPRAAVPGACRKAATARPKSASIELAERNRVAIIRAEFGPLPAGCSVVRRFAGSGLMWLPSPPGNYGLHNDAEDVAVPAEGGVVETRARVRTAMLRKGCDVKSSRRRFELRIGVYALDADTPTAYRVSQGHGYTLRSQWHWFAGLKRNPLC